MKRTVRTKIWCIALAAACVGGVAFGAANLPHVQAEAVSGGIEVTKAPESETAAAEETEEGKVETPEVSEVPEVSENTEASENTETTEAEEMSSAKAMFESHFTESEKVDFSAMPKIVRAEDGSISFEGGTGSVDLESDPYFADFESFDYGGKNVVATIEDVHVSDRLEYGLVPADNDCFVPWWINGGYPWLEYCELNEDGTLSSPHYAFAYVTIRYENTGDETTGFLTGEYCMGQYNTDGCILDMYECTTDKRELVNGAAEIPANAKDPNKTGSITLEPGQTRTIVFTYLVSDEYVDPITDFESAQEDGVVNYFDIVENYYIDTYKETDCRYAVEVYSCDGPYVRYDVSDIVNDFFTEHK